MALTLSSYPAFSEALAGARSVDLSTYRLPPALELALEDRARAGAAVEVTLAATDPTPRGAGLARANAAAAARLRAAGVRTRLEDGLHLKAAVTDGVAWLDDRNFAATGPSIVARVDDPASVARLRRAIDGVAAPAGDASEAPGAIDLTKAAALASEASLIAAEPAGGTLRVASEDFANGEISHALGAAALRGVTVRLLVDAREARSPGSTGALAAMARDGVEVRLTRGGSDKLCVGGDAAWIGSANATYAGSRVAAMSDWGAVLDEPAQVSGLGEAFEREWTAASPRLP